MAEKDFTGADGRADEVRLAGLKKHSEEIKKLVTESLQSALLILLGQKAYSSITVSELCRRAGVSRMAFYGNFSSMDDILRRIVEELHGELMAATGSPFEAKDERDWYVALFAFVRGRADTVRLMFDADFRTRYLILLADALAGKVGADARKKYTRIMWIGGLENAIVSWLNGGMVEPDGAMAELAISALPSLSSLV